MCENTKQLKQIAESLLKRKHSDISKGMTTQEKIEFVNSVATLNEHAHFIQRHGLLPVV